MAEQHTIRGVEIFRTGRWNDDPYSENDLDEMVRAAREAGYQIPLVVGHKRDDTAPAAGWVTNVIRRGQALLADLTAIPQRIYDLIKERAYDAISVEVFFDLERGGKKFSRALRAVSLLGGAIPAVNLPPLHSFLSLRDVAAARIVAYATEFQVATMATNDLEGRPTTEELNAGSEDWQLAGRLLLKRAQWLAGPNPDGPTLSAAMRQARREFPQLASAEARGPSPKITVNRADADEVAARVTRLCEANPRLDIHAAQAQVFKDDPALFARYALGR